jgi:F-type H+-transporting ATPase subunit epsilon
MRVIISQIDKVLFDGVAKELLVPGVDGDMTILPHHSPLVTTLRAGKITVRGESVGSWDIAKGILEVSNNKATVLL